jgi:hypothetical protein
MLDHCLFKKENIHPLVDIEAGSTLEPGLQTFRRRGLKYLGRPLPFSPGWYYQPRLKSRHPAATRLNY